MPTEPAFADLGDAQFVSLTTFRRSGVAVSTAVWVGRDGDALIVTTPAESGKVKRLRNSVRVQMRPCNRRGQVEEGVAAVAGVAEIITDDEAMNHLTGIIRKKYGLQFRLLVGVERLFRSGQAQRVLLRITPSAAPGTTLTGDVTIGARGAGPGWEQRRGGAGGRRDQRPSRW